jgi:hypothetical protein
VTSITRVLAPRAIEIGAKCEPAACALGRVAEARLRIMDGDVEEGLAMLDAAGTTILSGELDPLTTGAVYCELVCALQGLAQYDQAEEWTEASSRPHSRSRQQLRSSKGSSPPGWASRWRRPSFRAKGNLPPKPVCFVVRATIGRWYSRVGRFGSETSRAFAISRSCWPHPTGTSTFLTSSPPNRERRRAAGRPARCDWHLATRGRSWTHRPREVYRRRLTEIEDDIEEARALGDSERAAQADAERDFLVRELSSAVGLGGRSRRTGSASERARAGVTRAIRQGIARIAEHHPELGVHLDRTIRTGTFCAYVPDPRIPTEWSL